MVRTSAISLSLLAGLSWSVLAAAVDFSQADQLYRQRGQGYVKASQAHGAYRALLTQAQGEDLIYALSQMSRLDIYRGAMVSQVDESKRKEALDSCLSNIARLKDSKRPEYYYFYTACLGFRGKMATTLERLKYGLMMRKVQNEALDASRNASGQLVGGFEGGGILRVMSAIRGNLQAKPLGLYNPEEALQYSQLAINAPARQYRPHPSALSGKDYFENYYYHAQAQIALGMENNDKAKVQKGYAILENATASLNDLEDIGELPAGREPETKYYKAMMEGLKGQVNSCLGNSSWKSCLASKLN